MRYLSDLDDSTAARAADQSADAALLHQALVEQLLRTGHVKSPRIEAALRTVPRHLFLPDLPLDVAYANQAVPTKWIDGEAISSASQPEMVAIMLEQLDLEPGHRVLEIGAGTGYNAALLAHAVGDSGAVVSLDVDEDIAASARAHLLNAGFDRARVVCADGRAGYPDGAPFDRLIMTVGATQFASAWHAQLAPDGRMVLPLSVGPFTQRSLSLVRVDDHLASPTAQRCQFMVLRPAGALPSGSIRLDPDREITIRQIGDRAVDAQRAGALLNAENRAWRTGIRITVNELVDALGPWLALHEAGFFSLHAQDAAATERAIPALLFGRSGKETWLTAGGWLDHESLCLIAGPAERSPTWGGPPFTIYLHNYGASEALARRVLAHITAWDQAGRPSLERAHIRIYPKIAGYQPIAGESATAHGDMQLVVRWEKSAAAT